MDHEVVDHGLVDHNLLDNVSMIHDPLIPQLRKAKLPSVNCFAMQTYFSH